MKKIITLCVLLLSSMPSWSFTPESGFYWDPNASGSGYSIEIQDDVLFGAFYVYDDLGLPFWYTTSGELDGNAFFEGDIFISEDGPCLACNYTPNNTYVSNLGTVQINFTSETTATMNLLGRNIFLERHNFFLGDELQKMRGEWQVVYDVSEYSDNYPFFADVLIFEQTETFNGNYLATGCRSESTFFNNCTNFALNNNDLAASYDTDNDELIAVVRDDADYYLAYYLKTGTDQFDGEAFSYLVGSSPDLSVAGFPTRGFRSASKTYVDTGSGPSKSTTDNKDKVAFGLSQMLNDELLKSAPVSDKSQSTQDRIMQTIKILEKQLNK